MMKIAKTAFLTILLVTAATLGAETDALSALDLKKVGEFWNDDNPTRREDKSAANFQRDSSYIGGQRFCGKNKTISVAVFQTPEAAVRAMRAEATSVIVPGQMNAFGELKWWYTSGIPNAVFVNYQNTIITVSCYQPKYEKSKDMLQKAATILVERMRSLTAKQKSIQQNAAANADKPRR